MHGSHAASADKSDIQCARADDDGGFVGCSLWQTCVLW